METSVVRIGIAGCGMAARIHLDRLLALEGVAIVGCADPDLSAAAALADRAAHGVAAARRHPVPAFTDHRELLRRVAPDALAIFSPHLSHYRLAMDALQAGCHVFIEKPLSTNLQEAADIVGLARAATSRSGSAINFGCAPAWSRPESGSPTGVIGPLRLVTCILARPWLTTLGEDGEDLAAQRQGGRRGHPRRCRRSSDRRPALDHRTGRREVGAIQSQTGPGIDLVTAAAIRLADGTPVTLAISGISPGSLFALEYFGELGRLRVTDQTWRKNDSIHRGATFPCRPASQTIDGNFVAALANGAPLCCPADQALDTVRLLEAIARSAATGQVVRLI